jgi:recombinational DNA repair protein (RecF pathway)
MTQGTLFRECAHQHILVVPEKRGPHYAKEVCSDCRKFLRWLPKPETIQRHKANMDLLNDLVHRDNLTGWERQFVRDLCTHKHLSPRQQEKLDLLRDKYFVK